MPTALMAPPLLAARATPTAVITVIVDTLEAKLVIRTETVAMTNTTTTGATLWVRGVSILLNGGHDSGGIGAHGAAQVDTDADENQDAPS